MLRASALRAARATTLFDFASKREKGEIKMSFFQTFEKSGKTRNIEKWKVKTMTNLGKQRKLKICLLEWCFSVRKYQSKLSRRL